MGKMIDHTPASNKSKPPSVWEGWFIALTINRRMGCSFPDHHYFAKPPIRPNKVYPVHGVPAGNKKACSFLKKRTKKLLRLGALRG
jgi:hypothetical protein